MLRRSFLRLLAAMPALPFMGRAKAQNLHGYDGRIGDCYWRKSGYRQYTVTERDQDAPPPDAHKLIFCPTYEGFESYVLHGKGPEGGAMIIGINSSAGARLKLADAGDSQRARVY